MFNLGKVCFGLLLWCMVLSARAAVSQVTPNPTTAQEVLQQALAHAQKEPTLGPSAARYTYTKLSVTEELDSSGKVKEHKEKVWQVCIQPGASSVKLVQVNGRAPAHADLKKLSENEGNLRLLFGDSKSSRTPSSDNFLTPELVARFNFNLIGETDIGGRKAYELEFQPKNPEPPVHRIIDRLLNRLSGTVWIDAEDFEVARAEIHLQSEVDLLGGVAGCLKKLVYSVTRIKLAEGIWVNSSSNGDFEGRKLLDSMRVRIRSQISNFRPPLPG